MSSLIHFMDELNRIENTLNTRSNSIQIIAQLKKKKGEILAKVMSLYKEENLHTVTYYYRGERVGFGNLVGEGQQELEFFADLMAKEINLEYDKVSFEALYTGVIQLVAN